MILQWSAFHWYKNHIMLILKLNHIRIILFLSFDYDMMPFLLSSNFSAIIWESWHFDVRIICGEIPYVVLGVLVIITVKIYKNRMFQFFIIKH